MAAPQVAAFPFVEVKIDLTGIKPVAQRAPGVVAVVGTAKPTAITNSPTEISVPDDAQQAFGAASTLTTSLGLAMGQDPKPSKIYGVACDATAAGAPDYGTALESLESVEDVTFVSLAGEPGPGATKLGALKTHIDTALKAGNKRIGFAMVDPGIDRSVAGGYVAKATSEYAALKDDDSRMVLIAARGARYDNKQPADVATAAMAAVAGYRPQISAVLKPVSGFKIDIEKRYSPTEIKQLSEASINPVIRPALISGESLHLAEGRCFGTKAELLYIDIVRTLDDIDFRLKAGLIGSIGDARITKPGLITVKTRMEAILGVLQLNAVIDDFKIRCQVLDILSMPEAARTPAEALIVSDARASRSVEVIVDVKYGPAIHHLLVNLAVGY